MSKKAETQELAPLASEIVSSIILKNDLSVLTPEQRVQYVAYRAKCVNLDPAAQPFILIDTNGKLSLYATKEAAAQLNQLRSLSPTVLKEETLFDGTVYKVTYRVTENGRSTDDCGAVGLVKIKKSTNGKPDEIIKLSAFEMADAVMKAHTKAKRRAILTHCGIGTNDADETIPLVVPDSPSPAPELKTVEAVVKDSPKPPEEAPKPGSVGWKGHLTKVDALELPGGRPAWAIHGFDGLEFKTTDATFADFARSLIREKHEAVIKHHKNGNGSNVIDSLVNAEEAA